MPGRSDEDSGIRGLPDETLDQLLEAAERAAREAFPFWAQLLDERVRRELTPSQEAFVEAMTEEIKRNERWKRKNADLMRDE